MRRRPEIRYPLTLGLRYNVVMVLLEKDDQYLLLHRRRTAAVRNKRQTKWAALQKLKDRHQPAVFAMKDLVQEELGVEPTKWRYYGVIEMYFDTEDTECEFLDRGYAFVVSDWDGELVTETPNGTYKWVKKSRVPKLDIWLGTRIFLRALEKKLKFFFIMLCYSSHIQGLPLNDAAVNQKRVPLEDWIV